MLNPTNHSYFNLAGEPPPAAAYGQEVKINADRIHPDRLDADPHRGRVAPVAGTPFDFSRTFHTIGSARSYTKTSSC